LKDKVKDRYIDHLVFVTDPAKGTLRQLARERGIQSFSIPPNVPGTSPSPDPAGNPWQTESRP